MGTSGYPAHRQGLVYYLSRDCIQLNMFSGAELSIEKSSLKLSLPTTNLSSYLSDGTMQNFSDINEYPNRMDDYTSGDKEKGNAPLHFSSNSFLRNKKMGARKVSEFTMPCPKFDQAFEDWDQPQGQKKNMPVVKFLNKLGEAPVGGRQLHSDRSTGNLGTSPTRVSRLGTTNYLGQPSDSRTRSQLNFRLSPKKRVSDNICGTERPHEFRKSPMKEFSIRLFSPDNCIPSPKKLTSVLSSPYLPKHYQAITPVELYPQPQATLKTVKFKSDSTSPSRPRGYFNPKATTDGIRFPRSKPLSVNDFSEIKWLGKGRFGNVVLMAHKQLGFLCAVKIIQKKVIKGANVINQFCRQVCIQFYLKHPNIVQLYGIFSDDKNVYLLMEPLADGNLHKTIKAKKRMPEEDASLWIKQVCTGLDYMHKEMVIHRDIKPENIITHHGIGKIADFGWAVYNTDEFRKTFCGTPAYLSPELVSQSAYNDKIDVWTVGMLTYETIVGALPFKIKSARDIQKITHQNPLFPQELPISDSAKSFILSCLQKNPQKRGDINSLMNHPFLSFSLKDRLNYGTIQAQFERLGLLQTTRSSLSTISLYKREVKQATCAKRA